MPEFLTRSLAEPVQWVPPRSPRLWNQGRFDLMDTAALKGSWANVAALATMSHCTSILICS
jgi:hypothetical protein